MNKSLLITFDHDYGNSESIYITGLDGYQIKYLMNFIDDNFDSCSLLININVLDFDDEQDDYTDEWEEGFAEGVREAISEPIEFNDIKMKGLKNLLISNIEDEEERFNELKNCLMN